MAKSIFVLGSFVVACSAKVANFPNAGESLRADMLIVEPGGKGFNLAVAAARLGASVDGLLAIGDDPLSVFAAPALERGGLPLSMLRRFPGQTTGGGVGFIDARGENCLAVHAGANLSLSALEVGEAAQAIAQSALVTAQFEIADAPIAEAFRLARQAGVRTLLNPSPFRAVKPHILADTSILIVNAGEAAGLAATLRPGRRETGGPDSDEELAQELLRHGPDTLVITRGAAGAVAFRRGMAPLRQDAFPIEARDSLGAGDAFAAGLAAGLVADIAFAEALRNAAACGALVASRTGVFDALPTTAELTEFLAGRT
jgi:ribokinase